MIRHRVWSSSSWGCELKCYNVWWYPFTTCHPLREDVSWNTLRRDSSCTTQLSSSSWGCELKLFTTVLYNCFEMSSSSWGCELKCSKYILCCSCSGHPLREDVSWNVTSKTTATLSSVILFVRMWVEIPGFYLLYVSFRVILFVRMWVEITYPCHRTGCCRHPLREDVSWN